MNGELYDMTRFDALQIKGSYEWLQVYPQGIHRFTKIQFIVSSKIRLGMPLYPETCRHCLKCMTPIKETNGIHFVSCKSGAGLIIRHNQFRNILHKWIKLAHFNPILEKQHLFHDASRPADIFIPLFSINKPACVDIAITNPRAEYNLCDIHNSNIPVLVKYEQIKRKKYQLRAEEQGYLFIPFILNSFGGF